MSGSAERAGKGALDGIIVVDFSSMVAGPWCTRLLADCGAEVIKLEPTGDGDILRFAPPLVDRMSRVYAHFNAGKKSVSIDLKSPEGLDVARRLISRADVLVENYRPGVMARLGLDYDSVRALNPDIVYCSVSGFGQTGPLAGKAAYAPVVHAFSGFDVVQAKAQRSDAAPAACGVMIADVLAATYAFGAIQTALLHRARFGGGDHIDVTLLESMMSLVAIQLQEAQADRPIASTTFQPLATRDGHVMVALVSPRTYVGAYRLIGHPEWTDDPAYNSLAGIRHNRAAIDEALAAWARNLTSVECEAQLTAAGVPGSVYSAPAELLENPHLTGRGAFAQLSDAAGPFTVLNAPFRLASGQCEARPFVARPGEHTHEVIRDQLGLSEADTQRLVDARAFG